MNTVTSPFLTTVRRTQNDFAQSLRQHLDLFQALASLQDDVHAAATRWVDCLAAGGKIMICGNGGSAADSQHLAAELTGRLVEDRRPLAAMSLTTDTSALTCIANDYDFDQVFARQVTALGRPGDCLVAISTSGMSSNVVQAVLAARTLRMSTVGLLGRDGGRLRSLCDVPVIVPSLVTARVQEAHIFIGHTLCALTEERLRAAGLL